MAPPNPEKEIFMRNLTLWVALAVTLANVHSPTVASGEEYH